MPCGDDRPETQRITLVIDLVPEALMEANTGRMLHLVFTEPIEFGADVASVQVQGKGPLASW
jgi:hypothetical protein